MIIHAHQTEGWAEVLAENRADIACRNRAVMDSPPSLRTFPYHLCETSQAKKAPVHRLTKVKITSVRLELPLRHVDYDLAAWVFVFKRLIGDAGLLQGNNPVHDRTQTAVVD